MDKASPLFFWIAIALYVTSMVTVNHLTGDPFLAVWFTIGMTLIIPMVFIVAWGILTRSDK